VSDIGAGTDTGLVVTALRTLACVCASASCPGSTGGAIEYAMIKPLLNIFIATKKCYFYLLLIKIVAF
jgi:hypothetical protein